jgi:hypothetical protein
MDVLKANERIALKATAQPVALQKLYTLGTRAQFVAAPLPAGPPQAPVQQAKKRTRLRWKAQ